MISWSYNSVYSGLVTVVYGHLRFSSIEAEAGEELKAGETLGVLGTGYSRETL